MPHLETRKSIIVVLLRFGEVSEFQVSVEVQLWAFLRVLDMKPIGADTPAEQSACLILPEMRLLEVMLETPVGFPPCYCMF